MVILKNKIGESPTDVKGDPYHLVLSLCLAPRREKR
jgi:hypothetical protein